MTLKTPWIVFYKTKTTKRQIYTELKNAQKSVLTQVAFGMASDGGVPVQDENPNCVQGSGLRGEIATKWAKNGERESCRRLTSLAHSYLRWGSETYFGSAYGII